MHANQKLSLDWWFMSSRIAKSMETMDFRLIFRAGPIGDSVKVYLTGG
jgi:hypothetical protein